MFSLLVLFFFLYNFSSLKGYKSRAIDLTSLIYYQNINDTTVSLIKNPLFFLNHEYKSIYSNSIRIFRDNPFFGSGPKSYRVECKKYDPKACTTHPHQTYLQLLSEVGLFGFLFILSIFFYSIFSYFKHLKSNSYVSFIYLGIIINIWPLTSSGNFFNNWLSVIIFFPLGFLLINKEKI